MLAIEHVVHASEQLQLLAESVAPVDIQHGIAGHRAAHVLVVLVAACPARTVGDEVGPQRKGFARVQIDPQVQRMPRDAGDSVARLNLNVAVRIRCRVEGAVLDEAGAVGGGDEAVACDQAQRAPAMAGVELHAFAPGLAHVLEIARIERAFAADELDVIAEVGAVDRRAPAECAVLSTRAQFQRARHHLAQRRVGQEGIGQLARCGRVGTGQLHRGGRTHAFVVARVGGELGNRVVVDSQGRVEAVEAVVAVEFRGGAAAVADAHVRRVEAPARRDGPLRRER